MFLKTTFGCLIWNTEVNLLLFLELRKDEKKDKELKKKGKITAKKIWKELENSSDNETRKSKREIKNVKCEAKKAKK